MYLMYLYWGEIIPAFSICMYMRRQMFERIHVTKFLFAIDRVLYTALNLFTDHCTGKMRSILAL